LLKLPALPADNGLVPLSRRIPLLLAVAVLAVALALVPGRAESADWSDHAAAALWTGPTTATVTHAAAAVKAHVDPSGPATVWFEYGETTAYGSRTAPTTVGAVRGLPKLRETLPRLKPGTTYHVRLVAQDAHGRVAGPDTRFVTRSAATPARASAAPAA
jgi:hypothetical protein